jgi:hypothetical protein
MDEKEEAIKTIDNYIQRLENIKKDIDNEINSRYFNLSCFGDDIICASMRLFGKYHRQQYIDDMGQEPPKSYLR